MADNLICVQDTDYGEYFDNVGKNIVFLLKEESAEKAWHSEVHATSSSYFNLPDDCWIVASKSDSIGNWMEAYNSDNNVAVEELLREALDWPDNAIVKFFAKKRIVFQTKWRDFLRYWDDFIAVEDDCPIIIPENCSGKEALVFRPIGDILKIG
jgi:hypothetical protein